MTTSTKPQEISMPRKEFVVTGLHLTYAGIGREWNFKWNLHRVQEVMVEYNPDISVYHHGVTGFTKFSDYFFEKQKTRGHKLPP